MKLHFGTPPLDSAFNSCKNEWMEICEPSPEKVQLLAIPVAILLGFFATVAIRRFSPVEESDISLIFFSGVMVITIMFHEMVHILFHPGNGFSDKSVFGVWLGRLSLYSRYQGVMGKNRRMLTLISPLVIMTILPIAVMAFFSNEGKLYIALISTINAVISAGDVIAFVIVLVHVPAGSFLQDNGLQTYRKS